MIFRRSIYLIACILLIFSCQNDNSTEPTTSDKRKIITKPLFNKEQLIENLKVISHDSMEGRGFATKGNLKARNFIIDQFKKLKIAPAFEDKYVQQFDNNLAKDSIKGGNIIAKIDGISNKTIVITAHYDHLGIENGQIFNGADDNASGAAALIAIASYFKNTKPQHTLIFAALDGEENGFLGSRYMLNNFNGEINSIVLNINMDMISRNISSELYVCGLYHYPYLRQFFNGIYSSGVVLKYGHDNPNDYRMDDWTNSSDHAEFHKRNIPFLYFAVEDHEDYHRPTDTFENIKPEFYVQVVELIIKAIDNIDYNLSN